MPQDETIECTSSIPSYVLEATDNCDNALEITLVDSTSTQANNDCFTISRTWIASDNCGNTDMHTQVLIVIDTVMPIFTNAPIDETISCVDVFPIFTIEATDNCDNDVTVTLIDSTCLLYTSPSPRDKRQSRMPSSA